ncbi:MAG: primosome assembly protein PriA [Micrococcales bacterium]|nr:primosome assembly protein PriA [Micrococcales bacterium]
MTEVARVAVESPLPHLDRLFDFSIPEDLDALARPGCRVRVRFHGRLVTGWLIERGPSQFEGVLQPLQRVSGPPVLTAQVAGLCRRVADRYAGSLTDVVRFAVPPRVAAVEKSPPSAPPARPPHPDLAAWDAYRPPDEGAASWVCHPHDDPFDMLARMAAATAADGGGVVLVVPDARDVRSLHQALTCYVDAAVVAAVTAEVSNRLRYRTHLEILAGSRPIVIGTRSAVFAPVPDLALMAVWDDGDDVLAEPQTPGWHAREVAALRAWQTQARLIVGGYTRTASCAQWLIDGSAKDMSLTREVGRNRRFRVEAQTEPAADRRRIPGRAFSLLRSALAAGPVLVQVPRAGGAAGLICQECGHAIRCPKCAGGARPDRGGTPRCRLCHEPVTTCGSCGGGQFVPVGAGSRRSAQELQKAFPEVPVVRSDAESGVMDEVAADPALVVATPGAEPRVPGGFAALLILDTEVLLARSALRAREEAARRWMAAVARTGPDATTMLVAPQDLDVVQALVRNDLGALATAERAERQAAHMPPAFRCVRLRGPRDAVSEWLGEYDGELLGPLDTVQGSEVLLLAPHARAGALLRHVQQVQARRSKAGLQPVEVRVDPVDLGEG